MPHASGNSLIARLPSAARSRLLGRCEMVDLAQGDVLQEPDGPTRHIYFPIDSVLSLVASLDGKPCLEVGMIGSEGLLGTEAALGFPAAPLHAVVQGSGQAWRLKASDFRGELENSKVLRESVDKYIYVLLRLGATSAACARFHLIGPRLASRMLMSQDRSHSSHFHVTHEFLSTMLGVRRGAITTAAKDLQRLGLIAYSRGDVTIIDRPGLIGASCGCYATGVKLQAQVLH